jgi:hypothetical protein
MCTQPLELQLMHAVTPPVELLLFGRVLSHLPSHGHQVAAYLPKHTQLPLAVTDGAAQLSRAQ